MIIDETTQTILIRIVLAAILSTIIGVERQMKKEPAGLRTHMLVCIGSALFTLLSIFGFGADTARVAAGIVTGIGFLGAGTIIASEKKVKGLTTAASIWAVAAIGMAAGLGFYVVSIATTLLILIILVTMRAFEIETGIK